MEVSDLAYRELHDWHDLASSWDQCAGIWKEVVEQSPSVAQFTQSLAQAFKDRVDAAERDNDHRNAAAWSRDAVAFWQRQIELHPDLPSLRQYADDAANSDAEVAKWLAQAPSTQP
jgi:hypothetical protein